VSNLSNQDQRAILDNSSPAVAKKPKRRKSHSTCLPRKNPAKEKISKSRIEWNKINPHPRKGKKWRKSTCQYCGKSFPYPNFVQYHGEKCKLKNI
jgi:hypothetical protein